MHDVAVVSEFPEVTPTNIVTHAEDMLSSESAALTERSSEALSIRVASLETELADTSERIRAYQGWMMMALNIYLLFLLLGPVLDVLTQHKFPELRPYQYTPMIEIPCLWGLSRLLFGPLTGRNRPSTEHVGRKA